MLATNRTLRKDFRNHFTLHDAWPATTNVEDWIRAEGYGIKNGTYAKLKNGRPVDPKHLVSLVRYLRDATSQSRALAHIHTAFVTYCRSIDIPDLRQHSAEALTQLLMEPEENEDVFMDSMRQAISSLSVQVIFDGAVQACANQNQVRLAVRSMFVWLGNDLDTTTRTSEAAGIAVAEDHMKISLADYQARAISWWQFDPWTVVMARGKRRPTGMGIVLPLREEAYRSLLDGEKPTYDLTPVDLDRPSRLLLIAGASERNTNACQQEGNLTRNTLMALITQLAVLSHVPTKGQTDGLRVLTFAGSPTNHQRLICSDYTPTGINMAKTGHEFYERSLCWPFRSPMDALLLGLLWFLGNYADQMLQPPHGDPHASF